MAKIEVAKIPKKKESKREIYSGICFYYPQYKLEEVQLLPARDVVLLLNTAKKIEASRMYNLTQIVAAPHSKNGKAVKKLADYFKGLAK